MLDGLAYNCRVVGSSSPRWGRFAPRTFSARFGGPGVFNPWLPSLTPTGVGAEVSFETTSVGSRLATLVEGTVLTTHTFDLNGNQTAEHEGGSRNNGDCRKGPTPLACQAAKRGLIWGMSAVFGAELYYDPRCLLA